MTTDAVILAALRASGEDAVSGAVLAEKLGISRAAVWARIEELRAVGYEIQASPHEGYRLVGSPDKLNPDDISALLGETRVIGRYVRVFQETTSTNEVVDKLGRDGVKEGVAVFAESQTRGRGRLGRTWVSPQGKGLWFSVLLRPPLAPEAATQMTVAGATAVLRAIQQTTSLAPQIKWPNDLLLNGRKVCGILTEMSAELEKIKYIILGIGVNVNFDPADFPPDLRPIATSLKIEAGAPVNRTAFAARLLACLDEEYGFICDGKFDEVADRWEEHCATLGREVEVQSGHRTWSGRAEALDAEGALLVRTEHGRLERVVGGDVTIKK